MNDLIPISAVIGDRNYRVKINPSDEELVRKTLKKINDKIIEYKTQFAGKDMQDYIAMVLIWFATEQQNSSTETAGSEDLEERLKSIEKLLDNQLSGT